MEEGDFHLVSKDACSWARRRRMRAEEEVRAEALCGQECDMLRRLVWLGQKFMCRAEAGQ